MSGGSDSRIDEARSLLNIRSQRAILREIVQTRRAYELLASSGRASHNELQRAAQASKQRIKELNQELGKSPKLLKGLSKFRKFGRGVIGGAQVVYEMLQPAMENHKEIQFNVTEVASQIYAKDKTKSPEWIANEGTKQIKEMSKQLVKQYGGTTEAALAQISAMNSNGASIDEIKTNIGEQYKTTLAHSTKTGEYDAESTTKLEKTLSDNSLGNMFAFTSNALLEKGVQGNYSTEEVAKSLEKILPNVDFSKMSEKNKRANLNAILATLIEASDKTGSIAEGEKYVNNIIKQIKPKKKDYELAPLLSAKITKTGNKSKLDLKQIKEYQDQFNQFDPNNSLVDRRLNIKNKTAAFQAEKSESLLALNNYDLLDPLVNIQAKLKSMVSEYANVESVISLFGKFTSILTQLSNQLINTKDNIINFANSLKEKVGSSINELKESIVNEFSNLKDLAINSFNSLKEKIGNAFNNLKEQAGNSFNSLKEKVGNGVNYFKEEAGNNFNGLKEKVGSRLNHLKEQAGNSFNSLKEKVGNRVNHFKEQAGNSFNILKEKVGNSVNNIVNNNVMGRDTSHTGPVSNAVPCTYEAYNLIANSEKKNLSTDISTLRTSYFNRDLFSINPAARQIPADWTQQTSEFHNFMLSNREIIGSKLDSINNTLANHNQILNTTVQVQLDGRLVGETVANQQFLMFNRGGAQ